MSLFNPDKKFTQRDIAELLKISDRQVRNLIQQGVLMQAKGRDGMDPLASVHSYIAYKSQHDGEREKAEVDPDSEEGNQKNREQQLKNDEREERIKLNRIKRLVLEKKYAPIEIIDDVVGAVAISIRTRVDSWLPKIKMAYPEIPMEGLEVIKRELAQVMNELAEVQVDLTDYEDSDLESGLASFESSENDSAYDGSRMG
jgi:phage terminase Nu1 subunit (DNA packaging protein)